MFHWRVTKYNPKYRNERGIYLKDEWIMYSQIGTECGEEGILTFEDYLKVEDAYVAAIIAFMESLHIETLMITHLSKRTKLKKHKHYTAAMLDVHPMLTDLQSITKEMIVPTTRLILRENIWCKLVSPAMYVHFGWDYYMYIGSKKKCMDAVTLIEQSNLFVERGGQSPYLHHPE